MSDPTSYDPLVDRAITERLRAADGTFDPDTVMADDGDGEDALEFARHLAEASGEDCTVLWCPEQDEFRAGLSSDIRALATGSPSFEVVAVEGPAGPRVMPAVEAYRRMPARTAHADWVAAAVFIGEHRDRFTDGTRLLTELLVKRRSRLTRIAANRKSLKTMDAKRRKTARRAKVWRMHNKSKARRYKTLYHGPRRKLTREDIARASGQRLDGRPVSDITDDLLG